MGDFRRGTQQGAVCVEACVVVGRFLRVRVFVHAYGPLCCGRIGDCVFSRFLAGNHKCTSSCVLSGEFVANLSQTKLRYSCVK